MTNQKWKMENVMNNQTSDASSFAPSRRHLRAHWAGAIHLRHQTDRLFRDRVESAGSRRRLPFDPGRFVDSLFIARPGVVALYEP
jgi:hypothetical protein